MKDRKSLHSSKGGEYSPTGSDVGTTDIILEIFASKEKHSLLSFGSVCMVLLNMSAGLPSE